MKKTWIKWAMILPSICILVAIDYYSKCTVACYLGDTEGLIEDITSFFGLVYSWNYGISFGLFGEYYQYSNMVFLALNSLIIIYLCYLLYKSHTTSLIVGYSLVIGGALGNLLDRALNGAVFDFLYFHAYGFHFPVFNLADTFISLGVCALIYDVILNRRE